MKKQQPKQDADKLFGLTTHSTWHFSDLHVIPKEDILLKGLLTQPVESTSTLSDLKNLLTAEC